MLSSRGSKRDKFAVLFAVFLLADFCRFSLFLGIIAFGRRRFSQETADFRRKLQKTADFYRNRFVPFSLSLLIPPYRSAYLIAVPYSDPSGAAAG